MFQIRKGWYFASLHPASTSRFSATLPIFREPFASSRTRTFTPARARAASASARRFPTFPSFHRVLLNPWVRTAEGLAKAQLKHYYWSRLTDRAFWRKLLRGELAIAAAAGSFINAVLTAFGRGKTRVATDPSPQTSAPVEISNGPTLPERMAEGFRQFEGKVLLILSGHDLTAQEFEAVVQGSRQWQRLIADNRVQSRKLNEANHTFSTREWRDQVATWTADWVQSW